MNFDDYNRLDLRGKIDFLLQQNNSQAITGDLLNVLIKQVADSVLFIYERYDPYFFPYLVEYRSNPTPPPTDDGKYYIYDFSGTVASNVVTNDIIKYNVANLQWERATEYDSALNNEKDIVCIFRQSSGSNSDTTTWYRNFFENARPDPTTNNWTDAGKLLAVHNELIGLQGGTPTERFHLDQNQLNSVNSIYDLKLKYLPVRITTFNVSNPTGLIENDYYVTNENKVVKVVMSGGFLIFEDYPLFTDQATNNFNYIVLETSTNKNYFYDYNSADFSGTPITYGDWKDMGVNIHNEHNESHGLQGGVFSSGVAVAMYHLSENASVIAERAVLREKSYYDKIILEYIPLVSNLPVSGTVGDNYLTDEGVYTWDGSAFTNTLDTTGNKEYHFITEDTRSSYISKPDNSGFYVAGVKAKVFDHNALDNVQGGVTDSNGYHTEAYHVDEDTYLSFTAVVQNQIDIYVDLVGGNDSNTGLNSSEPVKTSAGIVEVLKGYVVEHIKLIITSNTIQTLDLGTALDSYLIKYDVKTLEFYSTSKYTKYSSVSILDGVVDTSTLLSLNLADVDIDEGQYIIDGVPFNKCTIDTDSGSDSNRVFITPKFLTNGTFDIFRRSVNVIFSTVIENLEFLKVTGIDLDMSASTLGDNFIDNILIYNAYLELLDIDSDNIYISNSSVKADSLTVNNIITSYQSVTDAVIYNNGVFIVKGLVSHKREIINYGSITNEGYASTDVIAFEGKSAFFDSKPGSTINLLDTPHLLLINDDSTHWLNVDNIKFKNTINSSNTIECVNCDTYVSGLTSDTILYESEETSLDVDIDKLKYLSNRNHVRLTNITIDIVATAAATIDIADFSVNNAVRVKIRIMNPSGKSYYKEVYVMMEINTVYSSVPQGIDNSLGLEEATADMFSITSNTLSLTLQTTTTAVLNCNIDIEIERTML